MSDISFRGRWCISGKECSLFFAKRRFISIESPDIYFSGIYVISFVDILIIRIIGVCEAKSGKACTFPTFMQKDSRFRGRSAASNPPL